MNSQYRSCFGLVLGGLLGLAACASDDPAPPPTKPAKPVAATTTPVPATTTTSATKTTTATTTSATTPSKDHAEISDEITATATVIGLDRAQRMVTLHGEDGRMVSLRASDEVRNFNQVVIGDTLRVRYRKTLEATRLPPGSDPNVSSSEFAKARTPLGEKPGLAEEAQVSVRVKIESIDPTREVVVFSLPSGELVAHRLATAEGRDFIKGVKVGDLVQLDYTEGVAFSIEEVPATG